MMAHSSISVIIISNLFLFLVFRSSWACEITTQTQAGPVCGTVVKGRLAVFRGVPYAQQPVGKLRFRELQPPKPWSGILNATQPGPVCPQIDRSFKGLMDPWTMDEACITANIHTPVTAVPSCNLDVIPAAALPVLVFVSGGGFQSGSGNPDFYGPEYFVDKDVVLITFNYRLNVFGFLSLNTTDVPGNQGLRDVLQLLRWVRDNVHFFGGDPDNVTLMGQSCGASAAHLVALSPLSEGLFKRLILASGTVLPAYFTTNPAYSQRVANMLLQQLGISTDDPDAAFKQLIDLPVDTILKAYDVVQDATGVVTFAPTIESHFDHVTTIVSADPALLTKNRALQNIPLLLGFTTAESRVFEPRLKELNYVDILKANPSLLLSPKLLYTSSNETAAVLADKIKKRYFKDDITLDEFMNECSDSFFVYPSLKLAQIRAENGAADTFLYQFSYEGEFRTTPVGLNLNLSELNGAVHTEDLNYIFRTNSVLNKRPPMYTPIDDRMKTCWIDTIVSFMKCSRPNCKDNSWPAVDADNLAYQDIKGPGQFHSTPISEDHRQLMKFFDDLGLLF